MNSREDFVHKLCYLGGALHSQTSAEVHYCDLEEFVASATLHMGESSRITQCFLTWLSVYGPLLSPSKLRRILHESSTAYDPAVMGAFLGMLNANNLLKKNWNILAPYCKKKKEPTPLFKGLPMPQSNLNPFFSKMNLIAPLLPSEPKKFLLSARSIIKNSPEIGLRAQGMGIVAADLQSFLLKQSHPISLYALAKEIHHPRTQVYLWSKLMEKLGAIPPGKLKIPH